MPESHLKSRLPSGVRLPSTPPEWLVVLMAGWDEIGSKDIRGLLSASCCISYEVTIYTPWQRAYAEMPKSNAEYDERKAHAGSVRLWDSGSQFLTERDLCDPGFQCLPARLWDLCCRAALAAGAVEYGLGHEFVFFIRAPLLDELRECERKWPPGSSGIEEKDVLDALRLAECEALLGAMLMNRWQIAEAFDSDREWWLQDGNVGP